MAGFWVTMYGRICVTAEGRSELSMRSVKSLSATATLVTGVAIRYRLDGQELERVGVTYVLYKADTRWKIAVVIVHDTDEVSHPE